MTQSNYDNYEPSADELLEEAISWLADELGLTADQVSKQLWQNIRQNLKERKRVSTPL